MTIIIALNLSSINLSSSINLNIMEVLIYVRSFTAVIIIIRDLTTCNEGSGHVQTYLIKMCVWVGELEFAVWIHRLTLYRSIGAGLTPLCMECNKSHSDTICSLEYYGKYNNYYSEY